MNNNDLLNKHLRQVLSKAQAEGFIEEEVLIDEEWNESYEFIREYTKNVFDKYMFTFDMGDNVECVLEDELYKQMNKMILSYDFNKSYDLHLNLCIVKIINKVINKYKKSINYF